MAPEREALELREGVRVRLDPHIAFDGEVSARSAIQKAHIRRDRPRLAGAHRACRIRCQIHSDALRNEVLDREILASDDADAIHLGRNAPRSPRRRLWHRESVAHRAIVLARILEAQPPRLKPIGAIDDHGARPIAQRHRRSIADQRGDVSCLARTIDAALGIDEGISRLRRRASPNIALT